MSEPDEYDEYYLPFDSDDLAVIDDVTARALARHDAVPDLESSHAPSHIHPNPQLLVLNTQVPLTRSPPSPDEFDAYDLSEFTNEDFAHIDAMVLAARATPPTHSHPPPPSPARGQFAAGDPEPGGRTPAEGGPRIPIAVERAASADRPRSLKDSPHRSQHRRSPYDQFRSWRGLLSVSDLAGPSWCEVQFDYGLRQRRHRQLSERPESFVTAEGKTIKVKQDIAVFKDRTASRGITMHKVLEREVQPEAVQVQVATEEERWALRLVNLMTSLQRLLEQERVREVPVFGFIHGQLVSGIIDEIVRTEVPSVPPETPGRNSPHKRSAPRTDPPTPSKPHSKRTRQDPPSDQPQITAFFASHTPPPPSSRDSETGSSSRPTTPARRTMSSSLQPLETLPSQYTLHLSDTKTRLRPSLPPDEDTYPSRVQLMLYHRLLSNLLAAGGGGSAHALNFASLWRKAGVDPTKRLSDSFLLQAGLDEGGMTTLDELVGAWRHAVGALHLSAESPVDRTLTLVYREQPSKRKRKGEGKKKGKSKSKGRDGMEATLSDQEARDIAAAIQASVSDVRPGQDGSGDEAELERAIFESLKDAMHAGRVDEGELGVLTDPFGPPIGDVWPPAAAAAATPDAGAGAEEGLGGAETLKEDPQLAWALQQSLLPRLEETPVLKEAIGGEETELEADPEPGALQETKTAEAAQVEDEVHPARRADALENVAKTAPSSPAPQSTEEQEEEEGEEEEEEDEEMSATELEGEANILGTKTFVLDDAFLDAYLSRVLAWWRGQRPPEGVDVALTRRCMTCEYKDGCEWREKKAEEALQRYHREGGSGGSRDPEGTPLAGFVSAEADAGVARAWTGGFS